MARSIALALSGGGARGAYEAGIIRYIREELPALLGHTARIDILCGTSVGAVTACFLAATMDTPELQGAQLTKFWGDLTFEQVYKVHGEDLWTLTRKMWRASTNDPNRPEGWRLYDILHPKPLEEMVRRGAPWEKIPENLKNGHFQALSVSTTHVFSGRTVVFVQKADGTVPEWSRDPATEARAAVIGPDHALASAAIPLLFRSVEIGGDYYCDGSLRQNTPLSPALRLGAEKVLIISLKHTEAQSVTRDVVRGKHIIPTTPVLMGKVLNALLLDHTDYDLDRLRRFNVMLETGRLTFGEDFVAKMNETTRLMRGQPYRVVQDLVLRPSRDIAVIAAEHAKRDRMEHAQNVSLPTKLLHRLAQSQLVSEADLASYLLFDGAYARDLISLGMEDAHAQKDALVTFFQND